MRCIERQLSVVDASGPGTSLTLDKCILWELNEGNAVDCGAAASD